MDTEDIAFIEKEIQVDSRIEEIFRSIEGMILKDAMDNFAQREDEIASLRKCRTKIEEVRNIYTTEQRDFINKKRKLEKEGVPKGLCDRAITDLNKLIVSINDYKNHLDHLIMNIESLRQRLKDNHNAEITREMTAALHEAYNKYVFNNEDAIAALKNMKRF